MYHERKIARGVWIPYIKFRLLTAHDGSKTKKTCNIDEVDARDTWLFPTLVTPAESLKETFEHKRCAFWDYVYLLTTKLNWANWDGFRTCPFIICMNILWLFHTPWKINMAQKWRWMEEWFSNGQLGDVQVPCSFSSGYLLYHKVLGIDIPPFKGGDPKIWQQRKLPAPRPAPEASTSKRL